MSVASPFYRRLCRRFFYLHFTPEVSFLPLLRSRRLPLPFSFPATGCMVRAECRMHHRLA